MFSDYIIMNIWCKVQSVSFSNLKVLSAGITCVHGVPFLNGFPLGIAVVESAFGPPVRRAIRTIAVILHILFGFMQCNASYCGRQELSFSFYILSSNPILIW